jgi:hypothetical protein
MGILDPNMLLRQPGSFSCHFRSSQELKVRRTKEQLIGSTPNAEKGVFDVNDGSASCANSILTHFDLRYRSRTLAFVSNNEIVSGNLR